MSSTGIIVITIARRSGSRRRTRDAVPRPKSLWNAPLTCTTSGCFPPAEPAA
jgi:hypothetical protein